MASAEGVVLGDIRQICGGWNSPRGGPEHDAAVLGSVGYLDSLIHSRYER